MSCWWPSWFQPIWAQLSLSYRSYYQKLMCVCVCLCLFLNSDTPTCFLNDAFWDSKRYMTIIILYIYYIFCNYAIYHAMRSKRRTCHLAIWFVSPFFQTLRTPQNSSSASASNDLRYSGFWTATQWQGRFFVVLQVDTMGGFVSWYLWYVCWKNPLRYAIMMVRISGNVFHLIWLHVVFGWFPRWRFLVDKCVVDTNHNAVCLNMLLLWDLRVRMCDVANEIQNSRCHHLHQNCWGQVTCKSRHLHVSNEKSFVVLAF